MCIIQARMGSSRFPGKTLAPLGGTSLLDILISRLKRARSLRRIVVATSTKKRDESISRVVERAGAECFAGSEEDVLGRILHAADHFGADVVVRVCADNPFTDPEQVDRLVGLHIASDAEYSENAAVHVDSLPDGVGAEAIDVAALSDVARHTDVPSYREHVTKWICDNADRYKLLRVDAPLHLRRPDIRLDVDSPRDLERLERLVQCLPRDEGPYWSTSELIRAWDRLFPGPCAR